MSNSIDRVFMLKVLEKIHEELREALHRTPVIMSSRVHIRNAYELTLSLIDYMYRIENTEREKQRAGKENAKKEKVQ